MNYSAMTKAQLIARLKDRESALTDLYLENEEAKKNMNKLAEWAGSVLNAAYSLGITQEQMIAAIKMNEKDGAE